MNEYDDWVKLAALIHEKFPFVPHTDAGRLYSTVRRMHAEKKHGLPIHLRRGFVTSVNSLTHVNDMREEEWEDFYAALCQELKRKYPHLYEKIFKKENAAGSEKTGKSL